LMTLPGEATGVAEAKPKTARTRRGVSLYCILDDLGWRLFGG
jgi:hypothetical protein